MKMKKILMLATLLMFSLGLSAQETVGSFVQNRTFQATGKTFRSEGIMHYTAPDQFRLNYLTPKGDYIILDGDMFRSKAGHQSMDIDTHKNPALRGFRNTVLSCVFGNYEALAKKAGAALDVKETAQGKTVTITSSETASRGYSSVVAAYDAENRLVRLVLREFSGNVTEYLFAY